MFNRNIVLGIYLIAALLGAANAFCFGYAGAVELGIDWEQITFARLAGLGCAAIVVAKSFFVIDWVSDHLD